jgi:hypothetical protein
MTNDKHEPFSLPWWLVLLARCSQRCDGYESLTDLQDEYERALNLRNAIMRRISRNFARRNRPQPSKPGSWRRAAGALEGVIERGPDGQWRTVANGDAAAK